MKVTINPLSNIENQKNADPLKELKNKVMQVCKDTKQALPLRLLATKDPQAIKDWLSPPSTRSPSPSVDKKVIKIAKFVFFEKQAKAPTPPPMVEPKVVTNNTLLEAIKVGKELKAVDKKEPAAAEPKKDDFTLLMAQRRATMAWDEDE